MAEPVSELTLEDFQPEEDGVPSSDAAIEPAPDPDAMRGALEAQLADKANEFLGALAEYCRKDLLEGYRSREQIGWTKRMERNRRSQANKAQLYFNPTGSVEKWMGDGHLAEGLKMGWTASAIQQAGAFLEEAIFDSSERPFVASGRGVRRENEVLPEVVSDIGDLDLSEADFDRIGRPLCYMAVGEGGSIIRYEMVSECELTVGPDGVKEGQTAMKPSITRWNADDVVFSDYGEPDLAAQKSVTFIKRGVTMADLEKGRQRYEVTADDPFAPVRIKVGRYFGLRRLRIGAHGVPHLKFGSWCGDSAYPDEARAGYGPSALEQYELKIREGFLPMATWIESGTFDHELCYLFDINPGIPLPMLGEPMDDQTKAALARRLGLLRYRVCQISMEYTKQSYNIIIGFELMLQQKRAHTAYLFPFAPNAAQLWPSSAADLAWDIEAAADELRNLQQRLCQLATNSPFIYNKAGLQNKVVDEIQRLLQPGGQVQVVTGTKVQDLIQVLPFQPFEVIERIMETLRSEHHLATGVSAISQGTAKSDTATQDEIALSQSQSRLNNTALAFFREIRRLVWDMQEDRIGYEGEEGWIARGVQASGRSPQELRELMPNISGIRNEVKLDSPITIGRNRAVMAQGMLNSVQAMVETAPELWNWPEYWGQLYALMGNSNARSFMNSAYEPKEPREEHEIFWDGENWIEPNPREIAAQHLIEHQRMADQVVAEIQANSMNPGATDYVRRLTQFLQSLTMHIQATIPLAQMQMALMQQVGAQGGGPGQQGKPNGTGGKNPSPIGSDSQKYNGMRNAAMTPPGNAMSRAMGAAA